MHKTTESSERLRISAPLLLLTLALGCTDGGREGMPASLGPEWQAHLESVIGSWDDPDQSLDTVGQVVIGPDGELFISQPRGAEVRVYDAEGTLLRTIGRRGEGPGEFGQVAYTGLLGDTLYVADVGSISFFSHEGDYLGSRSLASEVIEGARVRYAPFAPLMFVLLSDGTALVKPGLILSPPPSADAPGVTETQLRIPFYRVDSLFAISDTVVWEERVGRSVGVMRGGSLFHLIPPDAESLLLAPALDGTGLVSVERGPDTSTREAGFLVVGLSPDGDTSFVRRIPYDPLPVDGGYLREHVGQTQVVPRNVPGSPDFDAVERELGRHGLLPSARVPVRALSVGQDGSIWLQRDDEGGESARWQVLTRDGHVGGVVRLPRNARVVAARGDVVVTLELDEFDIPYVARYHLDRDA